MEANKMARVWTITLLVTLGLLLWLVWPQLSVVIFTALMAYVFYPLYTKLKRKKGSLAAVTTLLISLLVFIIPLTFITFAAVGQLAHFAQNASDPQYWEQLAPVDRAISFTNDILAPLTGKQPSITTDSVTDFLKTSIPAVIKVVTQFLFSVLGNIPQLGIALIIYIFLFIEFLLYGPSIIKQIVAISPFDKKATGQYLERIGLMANAMMRGQLIISAIISLFAALLLSFIGYGDYFFILFIIITILNFIPLGGGVLLVPLALYSMSTGLVWQGLVIIALYYLFGNIEPILRARLIPDKIQLSVGLTMLATFCGIAYFGLLGVVYGPIIMIIVLTTFEFYNEFKTKHSPVKLPAKAPHGKSS